MAKSPELEGWVRTLATAEVEKICLCPGVARPIFQFRNITLAEGWVPDGRGLLLSEKWGESEADNMENIFQGG